MRNTDWAIVDFHDVRTAAMSDILVMRGIMFFIPHYYSDTNFAVVMRVKTFHLHVQMLMKLSTRVVN